MTIGIRMMFFAPCVAILSAIWGCGNSRDALSRKRLALGQEVVAALA